MSVDPMRLGTEVIRHREVGCFSVLARGARIQFVNFQLMRAVWRNQVAFAYQQTPNCRSTVDPSETSVKRDEKPDGRSMFLCWKQTTPASAVRPLMSALVPKAEVDTSILL